jgi:SAM-dependent methyltransferase
MPLEAVLGGADAVGVPRGATVLEIGAGAGQLTTTLVEAGFDVVALEPGASLRAYAVPRVPKATFRPETFEEFEPKGRFDGIFSSNAFHWVDPAIAYQKAADVADALVLLWNTLFIAEAGLRRRVMEEVMVPHGSTFPTGEEGVRQWADEQSTTMREELRGSGRFDEPWWRLYERRLEYTPQRYLDLLSSLGAIASSPDRAEILAELTPVLGTEPFEVVDLVNVVAARAAEA